MSDLILGVFNHFKNLLERKTRDINESVKIIDLLLQIFALVLVSILLSALDYLLFFNFLGVSLSEIGITFYDVLNFEKIFFWTIFILLIYVILFSINKSSLFLISFFALTVCCILCLTMVFSALALNISISDSNKLKSIYFVINFLMFLISFFYFTFGEIEIRKSFNFYAKDKKFRIFLIFLLFIILLFITQFYLPQRILNINIKISSSLNELWVLFYVSILFIIALPILFPRSSDKSFSKNYILSRNRFIYFIFLAILLGSTLFHAYIKKNIFISSNKTNAARSIFLKFKKSNKLKEIDSIETFSSGSLIVKNGQLEFIKSDEISGIIFVNKESICIEENKGVRPHPQIKC